ncbi:MAG TPA: rod-binding protein [Tepidisphaeraceae bacterium]|jgi:Rod binding domain-containing protein|nr:rod-binding protein [Tepidisphaeraceae bacterium]
MSAATLGNLNVSSWRGTDTPMPLKPLSPVDLGQGGQAATNLKPLSYADFVVGSKTEDKSPHAQLVAQTQKWVAQTFYGTILKQMHNSPFKSEIFDGGRGGEAFSGLMDQHLAERMAKGGNNKLVKTIVRRIEARAAYAKQKNGKPNINASKIDRSNDNHVPPALRA